MIGALLLAASCCAAAFLGGWAFGQHRLVRWIVRERRREVKRRWDARQARTGGHPVDDQATVFTNGLGGTQGLPLPWFVK